MKNKKENNMNMLDLGSPGLLVFRVYLFFSHMQIKRFLKPEVAIFQMRQIYLSSYPEHHEAREADSE